MFVWRKILAHGLKRLATPALHLWRIRHGLVEELALCIKSLATPGLNASGGCEAAVTARVRIGWVRFRKCGELLLGNRFPLKMKGKVYCCCVRSAILYGSETLCLKENEKAILRRTERAMVRAMCSQKVVDRKTTEEQMDMLWLKESRPVSNSEWSQIVWTCAEEG